MIGTIMSDSETRAIQDSRRSVGLGMVSLALATLMLAAVGCGQNPPSNDASCDSNQACPEDRFCTEAGDCIQECDPEEDVSACGTGLVCTERGRCVQGECQTASDCDEPPGGMCDGDLLLAPPEQGECVEQDGERACDYETTEVECDYGCSAGECEESPCASKTCNDPPAATCSEDGEDRITYDSPGMCDDSSGDCTYEEQRTPCPFGCENGRCNDGPCDTVECNAPPAAECSGDVLITYDSTGTCEDQDGQAVCNYDRTMENCRYDGAECDMGACTGAVNQTGPVVVTEFMGDPEATPDYNGEWIEVHNTSGSEVDLQDWEIRSQNDRDHTIQSSTTVASGARAVLGLTDDPAGNGDVSPDYVYNDIQLSNGEDTIQLVRPDGSVSDHVFYEVGAVMDGLSRMLNPDVTPSPTANDDFENWCPALDDADTFGTDGADRGTPGATNSACSQMPCDDWTCQKPEAFCQNGTATRPTSDTATCEESRFNNPACDFNVQSFQCTSTELCAERMCHSIPSDKPQAGELVITELMGNPDGVNDTDGEWIEIYNPTGRDIPLFSLILEDSETGGAHDEHTFKTPQVTVPAGGYLVAARNADSNENGGVTAAVEYDGSHLKNSPGSSMTISLVRQDGTVVDTARYLTPASGASQQLDYSVYSSSSTPAQTNDTDANWCDGSSTYGAGGAGTPGGQNATCGSP